MCGEDDGPVTEREDLLPDAFIEHLRYFRPSFRTKEVGAADFPCKKGISRAYRIRYTRYPGICHHHRYALERMAWCLDYPEFDRTQAELVPFFHRFPISEVHLVAMIDRRPGMLREFKRADHIVLVPVGLDNMGDPCPSSRARLRYTSQSLLGSMTAASPPALMK